MALSSEKEVIEDIKVVKQATTVEMILTLITLCNEKSHLDDLIERMMEDIKRSCTTADEIMKARDTWLLEHHTRIANLNASITSILNKVQHLQ